MRFTKPGTFSHTFTEIMNEGVFLGAFKGVILNFVQLGLVLYPSVYFANKNGSDSKYLSFLSTYTLLDALFYPVDTLKNILYADTFGTYCTSTLIQRSRPWPTELVSLISIVDSNSNWPTICLYCRASTAPLRWARRIRPSWPGPWPSCFTLLIPRR